MFKVLKYLFVANLYKKTKNSFLGIFVSVIALIVLSLIVNDLISVASGMNVYILLIIKWVGIFFLLGFIGYSVLKIVNAITTPFTTEEKAVSTNTVVMLDNKKDRILAKEKLNTKSDLILQKYMKD